MISINFIKTIINTNKSWLSILSIIIKTIAYIYKLHTYHTLIEYVITAHNITDNKFISLFIRLLLTHFIGSILQFVSSISISNITKSLFEKIINRGTDKNNSLEYVTNIETLTSELLLDLPKSVSYICYYLYIMHILYPKLLLLMIPTNIFIILSMHPFYERIKKSISEKILILSKTNKKIIEVLQNIEHIKLNNNETNEKNTIMELYNQVHTVKINEKWNKLLVSFWSHVYNDFVLLVIYTIGVIYVADNNMLSNGGQLKNTINLLYLIFNTSYFYKQISKIKEIYTKCSLFYNPIIKEDIDIPKFKSNTCLTYNITNNIEYKNVTFSYNSKGTNNVIDDLSFKFECNKINLLLGPNGSGKSTLIKLLLRLYELDVYQNDKINKIYYKGKNIQEFSVDELRRKIIFVSYDPCIFDETVMYNIKYGNQNVSDQKIIELCDLIYSSQWFNENKYKQAGVNGCNLSGGEKKKIQLINALCKDSEVIIFDEPTNTLDKTSLLWFTNFVNILVNKYNKTIIIITHDTRLIEFSQNTVALG